MARDDTFPFDVFLSHNSKDKPRVQRLAERLKQAGLRVWFDAWVIGPGDDIYLAIERGLEASHTLVLCMSPATFGSDWVSLERSTVLFRDPTNARRRFVPLLLADCERPDTLRRYKYIDYRKAGASTFKELLIACRQEVETPSPTKPSKAEKEAEPKQEAKQPEPLAVLERKLTGHKGWVKSIAVSPDGTWMASGSDDKTVKIWDLQTGACRATLEGHADGVRCVAITPDGKRILSGANDGTIRVWAVQTATQDRTLRGGQGQVLSLSVLAGGKRLVSCGAAWKEQIELWDINSDRRLWGTRGHERPVTSIIATSDAERTISASFDGTLRVWNLETGDCLATLRGHTDIVNSVQIMPDERYAVSGSHDKTVKIWDLERGACGTTLEGHKDSIYSVAISPDGTLIASTGFNDGTIRLWDRKAGICLQVIEYEDISFCPISIAFSPDGTRLMAGMAVNWGDGHGLHIFRLTGVKAAPPVEATRRYVNAKVVLLGESGVGKSGMAHRLIEDTFVPTHSTHGMQVWRLDLPLEQQDTLEREALLWDLAGQEDYRIIHQLFLDETALALMLINPQKNDPFVEVGDWLKALNAAVATRDSRREVAKLLVGARVDVGTIKISQRKIDQFLKERGFAGYLPTSALRGDNCSDQQNAGQPSVLKQLIAQHIPWNTLPWTSTPRLLADIKNAVLDMTEQKDIRLLRFSELCQRLEQALTGYTFGEADVRTAVTLLANHGLVMPLKFGDLVLLRPELLNGYAGAVIRSARAHLDEIGCVREDAIYSDRFDFEGVQRLDRSDEELLLRAMVQTFLDRSLCIAEDTPDGRQLIFPSQYRRERPIPAHPEIFVSYTFAGELQTIYTTLVVRLWYSREFDNKELWQNAAEFTTSKGQTVGLVMARTGEGEGTVSVFFETSVPDELKVVFIDYVHRHLEKHARDVRRDRRYVCTHCGRAVSDLEAVRERLAAKKDFIICQRCDRKVLLIDHIEQRLATDPVARRALRMDERATRELDIQSLEQILIGHMMAICGEANQIFRPVSMSDYGINGEVEFRDSDGQPSGRKIYVQLKSGGSYVRTRKGDSRVIFDLKNERHLTYWLSQPVDVYLVIRDPEESIRWMNVTGSLKRRKDKRSRQLVFDGERLDAPAVWRVRDDYISKSGALARALVGHVGPG